MWYLGRVNPSQYHQYSSDARLLTSDTIPRSSIGLFFLLMSTCQYQRRVYIYHAQRPDQKTKLSPIKSNTTNTTWITTTTSQYQIAKKRTYIGYLTTFTRKL